MNRIPPLDLPAKLVARALALRQIDLAEAALRRTGDREDDAALHDLRVAVRRLRSILRGFSGVLGKGASKRRQRGLQQAAGETTEARDAEAQLAWLRDRNDDWSPLERVAVDAVAATLEREVAATMGDRDAGVAEIGEQLSALREKLGRARIRVDPDAVLPAPAMRAVLGDAIAEEASALGRRLLLVHTVADEEPAHRARISAKRLRYLLEPFAKELPDGKARVSTLKKLQRTLGDLRDVELLRDRLVAAREEEEDPAVAAAMLALDDRLRGIRDERFAKLEGRWLGDAAEESLDPYRALADRLRAGREGVEIERKYLLSAMPKLPGRPRALHVEQGWIQGSRIHERIRRVRGAGTPVRWVRTIKMGAGVQRVEIEEEAEPSTARALWKLTLGRRVAKRRYRVPNGDLVWEIDRFTDRDLVLAEVELPTPETPVEIPDWLAPHLVREVTGEPEYVNLNLAK